MSKSPTLFEEDSVQDNSLQVFKIFEEQPSVKVKQAAAKGVNYVKQKKYNKKRTNGWRHLNTKYCKTQQPCWSDFHKYAFTVESLGKENCVDNNVRRLKHNESVNEPLGQSTIKSTNKVKANQMCISYQTHISPKFVKTMTPRMPLPLQDSVKSSGDVFVPKIKRKFKKSINQKDSNNDSFFMKQTYFETAVTEFNVVHSVLDDTNKENEFCDNHFLKSSKNVNSDDNSQIQWDNNSSGHISDESKELFQDSDSKSQSPIHWINNSHSNSKEITQNLSFLTLNPMSLIPLKSSAINNAMDDAKSRHIDKITSKKAFSQEGELNCPTSDSNVSCGSNFFGAMSLEKTSSNHSNKNMKNEIQQIDAFQESLNEEPCENSSERNAKHDVKSNVSHRLDFSGCVMPMKTCSSSEKKMNDAVYPICGIVTPNKTCRSKKKIKNAVYPTKKIYKGVCKNSISGKVLEDISNSNVSNQQSFPGVISPFATNSSVDKNNEVVNPVNFFWKSVHNDTSKNPIIYDKKSNCAVFSSYNSAVNSQSSVSKNVSETFVTSTPIISNKKVCHSTGSDILSGLIKSADEFTPLTKNKKSFASVDAEDISLCDSEDLCDYAASENGSNVCTPKAKNIRDCNFYGKDLYQTEPENESKLKIYSNNAEKVKSLENFDAENISSQNHSTSDGFQMSLHTGKHPYSSHSKKTLTAPQKTTPNPRSRRLSDVSFLWCTFYLKSVLVCIKYILEYNTHF